MVKGSRMVVPIKAPMLFVAGCAALLVALTLALLVLPSALHAAPDLHQLHATLQTAQFEMHALDGMPSYFCH
jgi:hypothetical protein